MRHLLASAFLLLLASCHNNGERGSSENVPSTSPADGLKGVHRDHKGATAPSAAFQDPDGKPLKLADFRGTPVLVNLWATWCAPCVKELPTLDKLARSRALPIVAISEDTAPHASVVAFLNAHRIASLSAYQDPGMALSAALGADAVLPTSILIDANGREVWRYVGDLDWTSAEGSRLLAEAGGRSTRR